MNKQETKTVIDFSLSQVQDLFAAKYGCDTNITFNEASFHDFMQEAKKCTYKIFEE